MKRAALLTLTLTAAVAAHATTIIQNISFGPGFTDLTNTDLGVSKFDGSLGTLTGISLNFTAVDNARIGNENLTGDAGKHGGYTLIAWSQQFNLADSGANPLFSQTHSVSNPSTITGSSTLGAYDGTLDFAGVSGTGSNFGLMFGGSLSFVDFAAFTGTGGALFATTLTSASGSFSGDSGVAGGFSSKETVTGTLTYEYTAVPEPTSVAALGLGIVALVRRRRTSKRA